MTKREFHNGLRVLMNIDKDEAVAVGLPAQDWLQFRDHPWSYFIKCPPQISDGLFTIIEERTR